MMKNHIAAFAAGFILDLLFGDPLGFPHPVRLIGWLVSNLENLLYGEKQHTVRGAGLVFFVLLVTVTVSGVILIGAYRISPVCGVAVESFMGYQILAMKSLKTESMKVYDRLRHGSLKEARLAVSMIVGRDTECLGEQGVIRAAVETVAENTSDGVIAPMLYLAAGGPVFGFFYKAVNTMDSMIGYKNERYLYFGRTAAKLDDAVNFLPARISAYLMILAAYVWPKEFDGKHAYRIYRRDNKNHASPNSAQTESVMAGALGIRLAGDASYFGRVVKKPYIGDAYRQVETEDIRRANRLLYVTGSLCWGLCMAVLWIVSALLF